MTKNITMPNKAEHTKAAAIAGGLTSALFNLIQQSNRMQAGEQKKFKWGQFLGRTAIGTGIGAAAGNIPDLLEPATSPHHRKFFHSAVFTLSLTAGTVRILKAPEIHDGTKEMAFVGYVGIVSHLILDSQTPRGLPLI